MAIHFEKVLLKHQDFLFSWLDAPHVKAFWDNSQAHRDDIALFMNGRPTPSTYFNGMFSYWIGLMDEVPFCLIMTHEENEQTEPPDYMLPYLSNIGKTIALDFLIGNTDYLGKGFATPTLLSFMAFFKEKVEPETALFLIDPALNNIRAIHAYEKAGFHRVSEFTYDDGYFEKTQGILMVREAGFL